MYAIVNIAGQQFKVEKGNKIFVHRLPGDVGSSVRFDQVLLISNDDQKISIGEPYLKDAVVFAQISSHLRGDTVQVFKKKRRKGYQVLNGHRQYFTEVVIEDIDENGAKKAPKKKEAETVKQSQNEVVTEPALKSTKGSVEVEVEAETVKEKKQTVKEASTSEKTGKEEKKASAGPKKATTEKTKPAAKKAAVKSQGTASKKVNAAVKKESSAGKKTSSAGKKQGTAGKKEDDSK